MPFYTVKKDITKIKADIICLYTHLTLPTTERV